MAVGEQDVERRIVRVSPPLGDGPLPAPQLRLAMILSYPHPLADLRFLGSHVDLTLEVDSNEELDSLLQGLPYWGLVKMKATPLQDIEGRRERDRQQAEQIEQMMQR